MQLAAVVVGGLCCIKFISMAQTPLKLVNDFKDLGHTLYITISYIMEYVKYFQSQKAKAWAVALKWTKYDDMTC